MKQILADITPMGSNNLFVTHYWPDKQTDPPLHYHEDYMLCLTLHVRGQRIMDDAVEDFTEKDLVLINPGTPHRFKRDAAYADAKCETATVMFSREMPDWKFLSLEHMRPIREMLLRPAAGLRFAPKTIDTVLERMISLPKLDGFEAVEFGQRYHPFEHGVDRFRGESQSGRRAEQHFADGTHVFEREELPVGHLAAEHDRGGFALGVGIRRVALETVRGSGIDEHEVLFGEIFDRVVHDALAAHVERQAEHVIFVVMERRIGLLVGPVVGHE